MKIGIIRTSSIGDAVLATACLDYLRQVAPHVEVVWVGRSPTLSLISNSWTNVKALELPSKPSLEVMTKIVAELGKCDAVVDLQTSHRSRSIGRRVRKSGVPVYLADKRGLSRAWLVLTAWIRGRLFRVKAASRQPNKLQFAMMLEALNDALKTLGLSDVSAMQSSRPKLSVSDNSGSDAAWHRELAFGCWLGVAPGASYPTKMAPTAVLKDILVALLKVWPRDQSLPGLLFVGGPDDRAAAVELLDETHWHGPVLNLAGKLSLEDTARALKKASILLSNDSGLAHIAEAMGRPVAVLFGPTVESFGFPPQRVDSVAYSSELGCRPCSKHGKQPCRYGDKLCFQMIDTKAVAKHLKDQLYVGGGA